MNQHIDPSELRPVADFTPPTRVATAIFNAKVALFRIRRTLTDLPAGVRRLPKADAASFPVLICEARSPLWSDERLAERIHQLGKVENLRRAARSVDGRMMTPGAVFSFWKQVGKATERRGFVTGRMLQNGCLVPSVGGGLCQISNALYNLALAADCEIVERHAHSRTVPGSASTAGQDATVAWNYVDLRFRSDRPLRLSARLTEGELVVGFWGEAGAAPATPGRKARPAPPPEPVAGPVPRTCATCDETSCFRHETRPKAPQTAVARRVWLVDDRMPEFERWIAQSRGPQDVLGLPLDGARWRMGRYRWATGGFAKVADAPLEALIRSAAIRRNASKGPERRRAEIAGAEAIARSLTRLLHHELTEVVVAQSLVPLLWRDGWLGGRRFTILATRPPMAHLQAVLDEAAARHPDRASLADFRAAPELVAAEAAAFAAAGRIVSAHAELARLFPHKTERLEWVSSKAAPREGAQSARRIAFPGPTAARKGAWAVREAARALDLEVVLTGSELEGAGFWDGVNTVRAESGSGAGWLEGVSVVVQPALNEEAPRRLLSALAAGVPVVASAACGLGGREGLTVVKADDPEALIAALKTLLRAT